MLSVHQPPVRTLPAHAAANAVSQVTGTDSASVAGATHGARSCVRQRTDAAANDAYLTVIIRDPYVAAALIAIAVSIHHDLASRRPYMRARVQAERRGLRTAAADGEAGRLAFQ